MAETPPTNGRLSDLEIHRINESVSGLGDPSRIGVSPLQGEDGHARARMDVPVHHGASLAAQSVAQSMAIAVVDATDLLRNVETIMATTMGVAMAKWVENPTLEVYGKIVREAQGAIEGSIKSWKAVGDNAGQILENLRASAGPSAEKTGADTAEQ